MTTFNTIKHREIDAQFQAINLTEFIFETPTHTDNDQIIEDFIRSKHYSYESLRDCIKREPKRGYLGQAFEIDKIDIHDFKKFNKQQTTNFLTDLCNDSFYEDNKDFFYLCDEYFKIHELFGDNTFYVISKDWFEDNDPKVREPARWCYTYYFLIISVDRISNLLTYTEWTYD